MADCDRLVDLVDVRSLSHPATSRQLREKTVDRLGPEREMPQAGFHFITGPSFLPEWAARCSGE